MDRLLEATAAAERDHFWFRGFRRFWAPLMAEAAAAHPRPAILDCGCGTGYNLSLLRRHGHAAGIDITWTGLAFARSRGERRVAQASATDLPFGDGSFDIVTSFDVIFALDDPAEARALAEMRRVLRPGGHLIVNVAAMEFLRGNHSLLSQEVRRYTRPGLTRKLEAAGFRVRRITYTHAAILPAVLAVRLLQRLSGHRESAQEISVPPRPVNEALAGLLMLESCAQRAVSMPFGSSLLALAERT